MKVTIKLRESKLFKRLVSERLHSSAIRLAKKRDIKNNTVESIEANLKVQLQNGTYQVEPAEIYFHPAPPWRGGVHRKKGKETKFAKYALQDEIVISALYNLLAPIVHNKLLTQCIGGRKGYCRHSFLGYLKLAKQKKLNWVLITDVADYYYSLNHKILEKLLTDKPFRIPRDFRKLLMKIVSAGGGTSKSSKQ